MKRFVWGLLAAVLSVPGLAAAQGTETSLDLQHFRPGAGPQDYLGGVRGSDIEPHQMVGFSLFVNYQHEPFVLDLVNEEGAPRGSYESIEYQVGADFLWALGLFNIVQVGLALPVILAQDGMGAQPMDATRPTLASTAVRDLRLDIQARILGGGLHGTVGAGFGLAGAIVIALPTGDSENFAGDKNVVVEPLLVADYDWEISLAAARFPTTLSVSANVGARLRGSSMFAGYEIGHQLTYGAGFAFKTLEQRLRVLGEYVGLYGMTGSNSVPMEARFGLGYTMDDNRDMTVLAGAGWGFYVEDQGAAPGTPEFRVIAGFAYAPMNQDKDGDGIYDRDDQCLDGERAQEDMDGFEDEDGCMDDDNDGDMVNDFDDECPEEAEDMDGFEDEDGCPDPDNDGDGIEDAADECPDEAEDADGFEDENGCPDPDNDADGVPDETDTCADSLEDADGFQDDDGCLDADNDGDTIPDATDQCVGEPETVNAYQDEDGCPDEVPPPPEPTPPPRRRGGRAPAPAAAPAPPALPPDGEPPVRP